MVRIVIGNFGGVAREIRMVIFRLLDSWLPTPHQRLAHVRELHEMSREFDIPPEELNQYAKLPANSEHKEAELNPVALQKPDTQGSTNSENRRPTIVLTYLVARDDNEPKSYSLSHPSSGNGQSAPKPLRAEVVKPSTTVRAMRTATRNKPEANLAPSDSGRSKNRTSTKAENRNGPRNHQPNHSGRKRGTS